MHELTDFFRIAAGLAEDGAVLHQHKGGGSPFQQCLCFAIRYVSRAPPGDMGGFIGGQRTWTNAMDQGVNHYAVDLAGRRMAVMVKRKVLPWCTPQRFRQTKHFFLLFLQHNNEHGQW